jgi:hypothetical protein
MELRGVDTTQSLSRLHTLESQCELAKSTFRKVSSQYLEAEWLSICQAVEGKPPHMAFKAWRRTIPSSNMPLNSITERELDELPASIKASLNNMAGFYSKVMSPGPLPEWAAGSHPQPVAVPSDLDEHI